MLKGKVIFLGDILIIENVKAIFVIYEKLLETRKKTCNKVTYKDLRMQLSYQRWFEVFPSRINLPTIQK